MDPFQNSFAAAVAQVTGVLMVAAVMRPFARLVPGRSLAYWCVAWLALAVSLGFLDFALAAGRAGSRLAPALVSGYCASEYLFGFLVWAGCRELNTGGGLRPAEWWAFAPFAAVAAVLPRMFPDFGELFPAHAVFAGAPFAAALVVLRRGEQAAGGRSDGVWLTELSLAGTVVLFWHYPVAAAAVRYFAPDRLGTYMGYWKQYDLLLETGLAFGMVVLASGRVRAELASRNDRLAAMTGELELAARTDPLTGLLNRRALDDLAGELAARGAAGCVAALDLNDLKPLNDRHGHAVGDAALRVVARALRAAFRVTDPIFRTGGDEFLVVIPDGTVADLAGRLAALDDGLVVRLPGCEEPVDLRVAWGAAEFGPGDDLWAVAQRADAAMYTAKKKAKSGVVGTPLARVAPPPPGLTPAAVRAAGDE